MECFENDILTKDQISDLEPRFGNTEVMVKLVEMIAKREGFGDIIIQANVEDTRLAIQEYALEKLGVETVELKWGQGAKDIGGVKSGVTLSFPTPVKKPGLHCPSRPRRTDN
jgi:hypothetical protein